jgi:hypothetical protein
VIGPSFDFRNAFVVPNNSSTSLWRPKPLRVVYAKDSLAPASVAHNTDNAENQPDQTFANRIDDDLDQTTRPSISHTSLSPNPLPGPVVVKSLNRSENEHFYITHWDKSCLSALDGSFERFTTLAINYTPLKHALLALSACNLSRIWPESDTFSPAMTGYRPHRNHQAASQYYYSSAVGQVARVINQVSLPSPTNTLAALILFCYLESTMGNFTAFQFHADGIAKFMQVKFAEIPPDIGNQLLAAWILARYQNWWRRMNFSSFSFQRAQSSLRPTEEVAKSLFSVSAKRAIVVSILCESYRIHTIRVLKLWADPKQISDPKAENYIALLDYESQKLEDWHSTLMDSELPIECSSHVEPSAKNELLPLVFESHDSAMNYAYYVVSRIMQCTDILYQQLPRSEYIQEKKEETISHWTRLLVRITIGLDVTECAKKNVYSIGVSSLLMACLLRCHDQEIGQWIEHWLQRWKELNVLEEGSFPIAQVLQVATLVNKERSIGNYIYHIGLPEDDGGGSGKYASYNSQHVDTLVVKGMRSELGLLYSETLSIAAGQ